MKEGQIYSFIEPEYVSSLCHVSLPLEISAPGSQSQTRIYNINCPAHDFQVFKLRLGLTPLVSWILGFRTELHH